MVVGVRVPWRHAETAGYEILSSYADSTTRDFLTVLDHSERLLHSLVPDDLLVKFDVPRAIILSRPELMSTLSQDVLRVNSDGLERTTNRADSETGMRIYPNQELIDKDRAVAFVTRLDANFVAENAMMSPGHVRDLLDERTPSLPPWFVEGIYNLYNSIYSANQLARKAHQNEDAPHFAILGQNALSDLAAERDRLVQKDIIYEIPALTWISPEETKRIGRHPESVFSRDSDQSVVLRGLLEESPPTDLPDERVWNAYATLFVRWALDSDDSNSSRRQALWIFAARAAEGPVTEAIFHDCFGLSYTDVASRLNAYLPIALSSQINLRLVRSVPSQPAFRPATTAEVDRLKGDWERLALGNVKESYEDDTMNFINVELTQACARAPLDARLAAVRGLFECDYGDPSHAQVFLESAARAHVVGPRVYFELARIRYHNVRNSDGSPLSAAEIDEVIEPLAVGSRQLPVLRESFDLAAKVLSNSPNTLAPEQLDFLEVGLKNFPRDTDLLYLVAKGQAARGAPAEAARSATRGLKLAASPDDRARFLSILADQKLSPATKSP